MEEMAEWTWGVTAAQALHYSLLVTLCLVSFITDFQGLSRPFKRDFQNSRTFKHPQEGMNPVYVNALRNKYYLSDNRPLLPDAGGDEAVFRWI